MIFEILFIFICLVLVAFLSLVLVALIVSRKIKEKVSDRLFSEDIAHLEAKETRYRAKYPNESDEQILKRVIQSEAKCSGMVGFFTGLGGVLTLPIALPIDIFATIKVQYRLAEFLMSKNSKETKMLGTEKMEILALVYGSSKMSGAGSKVAVATITKFAPQVILKGVPIVGGVIGFLMDYYGTKAVAKYTQRENLNRR